MPSASKPKATPEELKKLAEGYRYVRIPEVDVYDYPFEGIHIAGGHYKPVKDGPVMDKPAEPGFQLHLQPGTHLLAPEIADEVERILERWQSEMIRLMRPSPHRKSQHEATRRGMDIVANPEAMS